MGFIESLRKSTEQKLVAEQLQKAQQAVVQTAQEEQRRQQRAKDKEFHEERRKVAEKFRQESGIGVLMEDLAGILEKAGRQDCSYAQPGFGRNDENVPYSDPDSLRDQASWNHRWGRSLFGGKQRQICTGIVSETSPDGTIIVRGGFGQSNIPLATWRNDRNELEEGLKKAYNKPANFYGSYHEPTPPEFRSPGNG
ncbi:MAG: hypothetical protein Q7R49_00080 [Candidatus Daviesbacteria bacterium]|nr:hypothetical protein [Candidatus Daviesbacteria bacterium]